MSRRATIIAAIGAGLLVLVVGVIAGLEAKPSLLCKLPAAKACSWTEDCRLVQVSACGTDAYNADYASRCDSGISEICNVTDVCAVDPYCENGVCTVVVTSCPTDY